ncbi:PAS domain-containing protein [Pleurocapsales cyanobacterium LEGE 10410]|nr:PAS domain-containing protein [Pleurocapsales cyanobacterium LEGE 10410]
MTAIISLWHTYKSKVIRNFLKDSDVSEGLDYWRKKLFAGIMIYLLPFGLLLVIPSVFVVISSEAPGIAISYISAFLFAAYTALSSSLTLWARKLLFLAVMYFIAIVLLFYLGILGSALTYFYGITIFALLIASNRAGAYTILVNALIFALYAYLIHTGAVDYQLRDQYRVTSWLTIASNSLILSIISAILLPMLFDGLQDTITRVRDSEKKLNQSLKELKQKNEEVILTQRRYNTICKITNEVIWEWDIENDVHFWSGENDHLVKTPENQHSITLDTWFRKIHPSDLERVKSSFMESIQSDSVNEWQEEYRFQKEDGKYAWVLDRGFVIRNGNNRPLRFVGGMLDISPMKDTELIIRESLAEKETLLAEIHHRVKNNLAAVTGMLQLQVFQEEDEELTEKLTDSMMRIKSIANIHEQLYQSNSFSRIDLGKSLEQLLATVIETMKTETEIRFSFQTDTVDISVNEAIPCSLVVNEVVTNIVKHAFPGRKEGQIHVQLTAKKPSSCRLEIVDDGVGLPEGFPESADKKLGMELITTLTRQLEADFGYIDQKGSTTFFMEFSIGAAKSLNDAEAAPNRS